MPVEVLGCHLWRRVCRRREEDAKLEHVTSTIHCGSRADAVTVLSPRPQSWWRGVAEPQPDEETLKGEHMLLPISCLWWEARGCCHSARPGAEQRLWDQERTHLSWRWISMSRSFLHHTTGICGVHGCCRLQALQLMFLLLWRPNWRGFPCVSQSLRMVFSSKPVSLMSVMRLKNNYYLWHTHVYQNGYKSLLLWWVVWSNRVLCLLGLFNDRHRMMPQSSTERIGACSVQWKGSWNKWNKRLDDQWRSNVHGLRYISSSEVIC